jgi:site-specific recombinase XerD
MDRVKMDELIEKVMEALNTMQLSESTLKDYKSKSFSPIRRYHEKMGALYYSEDLATEFVEFQQGRWHTGVIAERHLRRVKRGASMLREFYQTGVLVWKVPERTRFPANSYFKQIFDSFLIQLKSSIAEGTINGIKSSIAGFLCYLEDIGRKDFKEIELGDIRSFLIKASGRNPHGIGNIIFALRKFWKQLLELGATNLDVSAVLHKPANPHIRVLPCFTKDEAKALLSHAQDGSVRGSRNYAILLLVLHTGLRLIDIVNLKLDGIDWAKKEIVIEQHKTGNSFSLPLDVNAGNAIAEYILNFRPKTESPYVFLRSLAPFTKLSDRGTGANIINPYLLKAGIAPKKGIGFHAFRRSMGTWLIESGSDVSTTAQILGHIDHDSSKRYISLHHSGLRVCCMGLSGIAVAKEGLI